MRHAHNSNVFFTALRFTWSGSTCLVSRITGQVAQNTSFCPSSIPSNGPPASHQLAEALAREFLTLCGENVRANRRMPTVASENRGLGNDRCANDPFETGQTNPSHLRWMRPAFSFTPIQTHALLSHGKQTTYSNHLTNSTDML